MAKNIIYRLFSKVFNSSWKGKYGEKLTVKELKRLQMSGKNGKILRNIYIPRNNGETSEIDVIFITQKGIFVFESKNVSGWIFGNENDINWTQTFSRRIKYSIENPIRQNNTHMKWMRKLIGDDVPLFSIIVFSERCELKKVTVTSEDVKVIKRNRLCATVCDIWNKSLNVVSERKIENLYEKFKEYTNVDASVKKAHVKNIDKKYKKKLNKSNKKSKSDEKTTCTDVGQCICSKCGYELYPLDEVCDRCGNKV